MVRIRLNRMRRVMLIICAVLLILAGLLIGGHLLLSYNTQLADQQATATLLAVEQPLMGTPRDPHVRYFGRWDSSNPSAYSSFWPGAYLKTSFTGTTLKLKLAGSSGVYVSIDHAPDTYIANPGSLVDLTPTPLKSGVHSLRVAVGNDMDSMHFQGLILDPGSQTLAPTVSSRLIEFVGDSITVGVTDSRHALSDYAWLAAEHLSVEHTQIAQGGMCLVTNTQCGAPHPIGMSRQYFQLSNTFVNDLRQWDFSKYQATAVVINLGTNDVLFHVDDMLFQSTYVTFLRNIRSKFPHALIFAMEPFNGSKATFIQQAVKTVQSSGDQHVTYIDTTGWLKVGSSDFAPDQLHPTDSGQQKVAVQLEPILQSALSQS